MWEDLTATTWTSGARSVAFAAEVQQALNSGKPILLAHEMPGIGQEGRHAIEFDAFFRDEQTPKVLLASGVYATIAVPLKGGPWREASMALLAIELRHRQEQSGAMHKGETLARGIVARWAQMTFRERSDDQMTTTTEAARAAPQTLLSPRWGTIIRRLRSARLCAPHSCSSSSSDGDSSLPVGLQLAASSSRSATTITGRRSVLRSMLMRSTSGGCHGSQMAMERGDLPWLADGSAVADGGVEPSIEPLATTSDSGRCFLPSMLIRSTGYQQASSREEDAWAEEVSGEELLSDVHSGQDLSASGERIAAAGVGAGHSDSSNTTDSGTAAVRHRSDSFGDL